MQRPITSGKAVAGELVLVLVGINQRRLADAIKAVEIVLIKHYVKRAEVIDELLFIAATHHKR